jgi:hypothetical protein
VFPFNRIKLSIVAGSRESRLRFAAILEGDDPLNRRILERLRDRGCTPADLSVRVVYVAQPEPSWQDETYHVEFDRGAPPDPVSPDNRPASRTVQLSIIHGMAESADYAFSLARINLGRCAEVRDGLRRLVRTNHVVFTDSAIAPNPSVSRRHAHIEYAAGHYRIVDNRSAHGTSIVRNGRTIPVPPGSRGIRLQSGDEIVLGEARLSVQV